MIPRQPIGHGSVTIHGGHRWFFAWCGALGCVAVAMTVASVNIRAAAPPEPAQMFTAPQGDATLEVLALTATPLAGSATWEASARRTVQAQHDQCLAELKRTSTPTTTPTPQETLTATLTAEPSSTSAATDTPGAPPTLPATQSPSPSATSTVPPASHTPSGTPTSEPTATTTVAPSEALPTPSGYVQLTPTPARTWTLHVPIALRRI